MKRPLLSLVSFIMLFDFGQRYVPVNLNFGTTGSPERLEASRDPNGDDNDDAVEG